jgi:hypothetical protein
MAVFFKGFVFKIMALTDQPYLPLYVDDWMNNTKLKLCSPGAHGLMISIMCLMHKSESYGIILLKQKFKQSDKQELNFASQIARLSSFDLFEIEKYFYELIDEKVLEIDGDNLICSRMVKDAEISKKRASSGKSGGKKTQISIKNFAKANIEANTVIGNENESEYEDEKEVKNEIEKKCKINFQKIIENFNSICKDLPNVEKLTKQRESALSSRIKEYGIDKVHQVFQIVSLSDFLSGRKGDWKSSFDWIMKPSNFQKILEGNYVNKPQKTEKEQPMYGRMTQEKLEESMSNWVIPK